MLSKYALPFALFTVLTGSTWAEDTTVLDCSPPAAIGFKAAREKIYIHGNSMFAVYQYVANTPERSYQVAFGSNADLKTSPTKIVDENGSPYQMSAVVPTPIFLGGGMDGAQMQIFFNAQTSAIEFSRDPESHPEIYPCRIETRVSVDWDKATAAIVQYAQGTAATSVF